MVVNKYIFHFITLVSVLRQIKCLFYLILAFCGLSTCTEDKVTAMLKNLNIIAQLHCNLRSTESYSLYNEGSNFKYDENFFFFWSTEELYKQYFFVKYILMR